MADIIDEITNDEKDAKKFQAFRSLLPYVILFTIIVSALMFSFSYYQAKKNDHKQQIGDMLVDLVAENFENEEVKAKALSEVINNSDIRQAELAQLQLALNKIPGENNEAMNILLEIAANEDYLAVTRSFAKLNWLSLALDGDMTEEIQNQSRALFQSYTEKSQPFYNNVILLRGLFHLRNGDKEMAEKIANELINSTEASIVIREQATALQTNIKYTK